MGLGGELGREGVKGRGVRGSCESGCWWSKRLIMMKSDMRGG